MSALKALLADIDIKDVKLKKFLDSLSESVDLLQNNLLIGDKESKLLEPRANDLFARVLPEELIVDSIRFTEDLNGLVLRSSNSMWAQVTNSAAIAIPTAAYTTLTWDTVQFDTDGIFNSANPSRFTAKHEGIYLISAAIIFAGNAGGTIRELGIRRNNCRTKISVPPIGTTDIALTATTIQRMVRGNFAEAFCYQDSGGNLNSIQTLTSTAGAPFFQIHRLS